MLPFLLLLELLLYWLKWQIVFLPRRSMAGSASVRKSYRARICLDFIDLLSFTLVPVSRRFNRLSSFRTYQCRVIYTYKTKKCLSGTMILFKIFTLRVKSPIKCSWGQLKTVNDLKGSGNAIFVLSCLLCLNLAQMFSFYVWLFYCNGAILHNAR